MLCRDDYASHFVRGLPFFKGMPESDLDCFLSAAAIKIQPKNAPLFHHGDMADRIFVVLGGWIKVFRNTEEGDEAIIALFSRGDVFGEAALFSGGHYPFSAQVAEESRLIEIPGALVKERAKANPDIMTRVMHSMSREMHKLQMEIEHMAIMSAPQRVGCLLLQLSSGMVGQGGTLLFPYDKSLAAARLGMKPETFSRALSQLRPLGVTSKGTEINIESFYGLAEYCCGSCSAELDDCKGAIRRLCSEIGCPAYKEKTAI